jgi:O-antigen ligase
MRNLTRYLLWAFLFTVPWDNFALPIVGSISRAFGLAVICTGVLTTMIEGRVRRPDAVLVCAAAFSMWTGLSLLWTISYGSTVVLALTYAQLAAGVWVIREFVRTREQLQPLLAALLLGSFVPLLDLLNNFRLDRGGAGMNANRFTGAGINADGVGLLMVLILPIAWYLLMHRRGVVRVAALAYVVGAPIGLLLTATRGAFVAGIAALAIVPLTLPRLSVRSSVLGGGLLLLVTLSTVLVVPRYNWERILSTSTEISEGGSMSGRARLWNSGSRAILDRPLLGAGAGAYRVAIEPYFLTKVTSAHNVAIGLLVEDGIVGLTLFAAIFAACAWTVFRSPPPYGALFGVLLLTWLVGGLSGNPEATKLTWVTFGLVSAQSGLPRAVGEVSAMAEARSTANGSLRTATT